MLIADGGGGGGTKTIIKSTSSGTSQVSNLQTTSGVPVTAVTIEQQGTGEIQVSGSVIGQVVVQQGSVKFLDAQSVPLAVIGVATFLAQSKQELVDGFADYGMHSIWQQRAANGQATERSDQIVCNFPFAAAPSSGLHMVGSGDENNAPMIFFTTPLNHLLLVAHISAFHFDPPTAIIGGDGSNIGGGIAISKDVSSGTLSNIVLLGRRNKYDTNGALEAQDLQAFMWVPGATGDVILGTVTLTQNSDLWLSFKRNARTVACYYRTSAPVPGEDIFTLLGSSSVAFAADVDPSQVAILAWRSDRANMEVPQTGDGLDIAMAAMIACERITISADRGPS